MVKTSLIFGEQNLDFGPILDHFEDHSVHFTMMPFFEVEEKPLTPT